MDRRVNRGPIDRWIDKNGPDGLLELAKLSGVSSSTITKARLGVVPKRQRTRDRLCGAMNVTEVELFPPATNKGKAKAS